MQESRGTLRRRGFCSEEKERVVSSLLSGVPRCRAQPKRRPAACACDGRRRRASSEGGAASCV